MAINLTRDRPSRFLKPGRSTSAGLSCFKWEAPPIDKKNEIAEYIANVRKQAKQLQIAAAQILADAKAEVERLILGE